MSFLTKKNCSWYEKIGKYCDENNIAYTRYSDDLSFSGDFDVKTIINMVAMLLKEKGFKLNEKKIKVVFNKTRQQITGIVVNKKMKLKIQKKMIMKISRKMKRTI